MTRRSAPNLTNPPDGVDNKDRPSKSITPSENESPETFVGFPPLGQTEIHSAVHISKRLPQSKTSVTTATKPSESVRSPVRAATTSRKRASTRRKSKTGVDVEPITEPERTWPEEIRFWIKSTAGLGYALSLLTHLSILIVLAIWLIPQIIGDKGFSVNVATSDDSDGKTEEILDTKFELPEIEAATEAPQVVMPLESTSTLTENEITSDISARVQASIGEGAGEDDLAVGGGEPGKNAVVKGSFTAWTVPEDPEPGQDYQIIIRIKLPERVKKDYPLRDLSGLVMGTDGYRQMIPGPKKVRYARVRKGYAQIDVTVPGAYRLVKDKIVVRSRMLEEEQLLEIVF
ncbi:MAG: hypothetical protein O2955_09315 [Planctomycetota bacterium]|nr:hypothetical protein [Planctomycetota bacterium]MDA1212707.1 hypothetical protein [Planctomycetota bacterium]